MSAPSKFYNCTCDSFEFESPLPHERVRKHVAELFLSWLRGGRVMTDRELLESILEQLSTSQSHIDELEAKVDGFVKDDKSRLYGFARNDRDEPGND